MFFFCSRDTTIINHSPCHSSNNSFNEDLPVADHRNQEMENRCIPTIYQPPFLFQTSLQDLPLFFIHCLVTSFLTCFFCSASGSVPFMLRFWKKMPWSKSSTSGCTRTRVERTSKVHLKTSWMQRGQPSDLPPPLPPSAPQRATLRHEVRSTNLPFFDPKTYIFVYRWKVWNKKVHMLTFSVTLSRR